MDFRKLLLGLCDLMLMPSCASDPVSDGYADDREDDETPRSREWRSNDAMFNVDGTPMVNSSVDVNGAPFGFPRSWSE